MTEKVCILQRLFERLKLYIFSVVKEVKYKLCYQKYII